MSKRTPSKWQSPTYIEQAVEEIKKNNPQMYAKAQEFGEFMLSTRFADVEQTFIEKRDIEGENILYNKILRDIKQYGFKKEDMDSFEIDILKNKLGDKWESVFNEVENETVKTEKDNDN